MCHPISGWDFDDAPRDTWGDGLPAGKAAVLPCPARERALVRIGTRLPVDWLL
jgi:hypothetical protein